MSCLSLIAVVAYRIWETGVHIWSRGKQGRKFPNLQVLSIYLSNAFRKYLNPKQWFIVHSLQGNHPNSISIPTPIPSQVNNDLQLGKIDSLLKMRWEKERVCERVMSWHPRWLTDRRQCCVEPTSKSSSAFISFHWHDWASGCGLFFFFFFKLPAIYPLDSLPILYGQNECPLPTACTRYYLYIYKLERIPISFQSWIKDNDNGMTMVSSHEKVLYMNGEI